MSKKRKPSYLLHKPTGQARVRIDGKDHYLGEYGSPESRERYDDLIAEWFAKGGDTTGYRLTVDDLALLYVEHAESYYRKNGKTTSEVCKIRLALRPLVRLYGPTRARDVGPKKLKAVRQAMIDHGCCRTSINRQIGRIKRMFRWGTENEYLPVGVHAALATVPGLRRGRTEAVESPPVKPVPLPFVEAIQPYVSRQVWTMTQLQILSGMRPGEVVAMRGCDLNMSGSIWEYTPSAHKTEHHGRHRIVFLGPKAQSLIREFLMPDLQAFLFSPADAREEFDAARRANRKTPMTPSQRLRTRIAKPKKAPAVKYTVCSYGHAVRKACERAGVPHWHPNQLRHNAATLLRREYGIEAARTVLGHVSAVTTEVYAELDAQKAKDIIAKIG